MHGQSFEIKFFIITQGFMRGTNLSINCSIKNRYNVSKGSAENEYWVTYKDTKKPYDT